MGPSRCCVGGLMFRTRPCWGAAALTDLNHANRLNQAYAEARDSALCLPLD